MSASPEIPPRAVRLVQALPVLAALQLNAAAHGRWLLAAPAALALVVGLWRGWRFRFGEGLVAGAAVAGAALGYGYGVIAPAPNGPVPGFLLSPMCGALVPLSVAALLSGARTYAWIFAWLLAALSTYLHVASPAVTLSFAALAVATLVAATLAQGDSVRRGAASAVALGAALVATGAATAGVGRGLWATEGTLISLVGGGFDSLAQKLRASDYSLPKAMWVGGRGRVPDSRRALFEAEGALPSHLRGAVYDRFDGREWSTSPELEKARQDLGSLGPPRERAETRLTFYGRLGDQLPSPAGVREVKGAAAEAKGGWVLSTTDLRGLSVTVAGERERLLPAEPRPAPGLTALPDELRAALRPLAEEIARGAATPRQQADAIERFFQVNFRYSLEANVIGREHPLVVLVKERKPAYCTYFASAMAALLRSLDVPARLVGGFVLEAPNPLTGKAVVRERDAHAWVEVWMPDEGRYASFDPTPAESRGQALGLSRGGLRALGDAIGAWADAQIALLRRSPADFFYRLATAPAVLGAVALLVAWRVLRRLRRRSAAAAEAAGVAADPRLAEIHARYRRLLRARAGIEVSPVETDDAVLERLRAADGAAAAVAARFLERYRKARYGGGAWTPEALQGALAEVDRALGDHPR